MPRPRRGRADHRGERRSSPRAKRRGREARPPGPCPAGGYRRSRGRQSGAGSSTPGTSSQKPLRDERSGAGAVTLVGGADEALDAGLLDRPAQAVVELDRRLPAEQIAGAADVGLALLRVVDRQLLVDDLRARLGHLDHGLGQLQQRELVRIADVDRHVHVGLGEGDDSPDQVVDVTEAARLAAVPEDGQRPVLQRLAQEGRDRAAVVRAHARAVGVEDADDRGVDALLAVVGHGQRLGVALRLVVDAARADRVDVAPVVLFLRVDLGVAVDLAGRGDEEAGALELGDPEHVMGAVGADLERVQRQAQVVDRARRRGEGGDEGDLLGDVDVRGDVDVAELERIVTDVGDVLQRPGLEVVEADHPVPLAKQVLAEVGPEEAGAAGDYAGAHRDRCYRGRRRRGAWGRCCNFRESRLENRPEGGRGPVQAGLGLPCSVRRIEAAGGNRVVSRISGGEGGAAAPRGAAGPRKRAALETYARHEDALRRPARPYSPCGAAARHALPPAPGILLTKAPTDDPRELIRWTQTVVKHEALAVLRDRERILSGPAAIAAEDGREDWVALIPTDADGPPERAERHEAIAPSRGALPALKPQELRALSLLAEGYFYAEIGAITGFSQTKGNRF